MQNLDYDEIEEKIYNGKELNDDELEYYGRSLCYWDEELSVNR